MNYNYTRLFSLSYSSYPVKQLQFVFPVLDHIWNKEIHTSAYVICNHSQPYATMEGWLMQFVKGLLSYSLGEMFNGRTVLTLMAESQNSKNRTRD